MADSFDDWYDSLPGMGEGLLRAHVASTEDALARTQESVEYQASDEGREQRVREFNGDHEPWQHVFYRPLTAGWLSHRVWESRRVDPTMTYAMNFYGNIVVDHHARQGIITTIQS